MVCTQLKADKTDKHQHELNYSEQIVFNSWQRCKSDGSISKPAAFGPEFAVRASPRPPLGAAPSSVVIPRKTKGVGYKKPVL